MPKIGEGEMPMSYGNVSRIEELGQCSELVGATAKAMALIAPKMTKEARQSWIGLPPADFAHVLEEQVFIPSQEVQPAPALIIPPARFKTTDTDLDSWLDKCQEFTEQYLSLGADLREMFAIPGELPWQSVIPVFDPGGLTNKIAYELLKKLKLDPWQEVDVMQYSGSEANQEPTLHFIQNSIEPDDDTMDLTPDQLVATGKNCLSQRGYMLAFGLHNRVTRKHLDPKTWTWFPNNRFHSDKVADGSWFPATRGVGFGWDDLGNHYPYVGARLAVPVPLRS